MDNRSWFQFFPVNLSMFWSVRLAAGSPILAGLLFPLQGDAPRMGRETAGFTACPPSPTTTSQPELQLQLRTQPTLLLCERERTEGYASLLVLQTTWDIFSQTPNTAQLAPLPKLLSAFTLGKPSPTHFESLKSCLLTLILTSSPLRRTQPEESKTNPRYLHLTSESKEKRAFIN